MYKVQRTCKAIVFLVQPFVSHVLVADVFLICMSLRIKEKDVSVNFLRIQENDNLLTIFFRLDLMVTHND